MAQDFLFSNLSDHLVLFLHSKKVKFLISRRDKSMLAKKQQKKNFIWLWQIKTLIIGEGTTAHTHRGRHANNDYFKSVPQADIICSAFIQKYYN